MPLASSFSRTSEILLTNKLTFVSFHKFLTDIYVMVFVQADVQLWSDTEKLLLYLKLPGSKHRDKSKDEQE